MDNRARRLAMAVCGGLAGVAALCPIGARAQSPPSRPSMLDGLSRLAPVVSCLDRAPPGDDKRQEACMNPAGLSFARTGNQLVTLKEFRSNALEYWVTVNAGPDRHRNTRFFTDAIGYARCVETAAYADPDLASRKWTRIYAVQRRAEQACSDHPLAPRGVMPEAGRPPGTPIGPLFAETLAMINLVYVLQANGWFPPRERACYHLDDGRPPPAGCIGSGEAAALDEERSRTRPSD
jgi:hypothetical protein